METFLRCAFISEKFFLLVVFMFFFLSKIFSQSKVEEQITEQPKHFHDLCEASKNGVKAAKLIAQDSFFSVAKTSIQQVGQDKHEHSITFGRDASGNLTISPMINGDSTNGKINSGWLGAFADIHNHSNDQPPSAGDLYYLVKLNNKNHLYNTRFVLTKSGTVYALYVYDLALANEFVNKYPLEQMPGFSPRFPEPIFDEIDRISTYLEGQGIDRLIARERALSFILTKYNSGAIVLKQDSNGNFKALQIEEKISNGVKNYVEKDCGYISKSDEESKLLYGS